MSLLVPAEDDTAVRLKTSLTYGSQFDPLNRVKAQKAAAATGTTPEVVGQDPDGFVKRYLTQNEDYDSVVQRAPTAAQMLADPRNAELLHLDMGKLIALEEKHKEVEWVKPDGSVFTNLVNGTGAYAESALGSFISGSINVGKGFTTDAVRLQRQMTKPISDALRDWSPTYDRLHREDDARMAEFDKAVFEPGQNMAARTVNNEDWTFKAVNAVAGSAPQFILALATRGRSTEAVATKAATGTLAKIGQYFMNRAPEMLAQTAVMFPGTLTAEADEFQQFNPGVDRQTAVGLSAVSALAQSVLEGLVNVPVIERMQAAKTVKQRLVGLFLSAQMEGAEEVAQRLTSQALLPDPSGQRKLTAQDLWENYYGGAAAGGLFGAGAIKAPKMHIAQQFIQALHDTKEQSAVFKQMPEKLGEYVKELTKNGPLQDAIIPAKEWNTYWQEQGQDPQVKAAEVGVDEGAYNAAVSGESDLVFPMSAFGEKIAGTTHFQPLFEHMRPTLLAPTFGEDAKSRANAQEAEQIAQAISVLPESSERSAIREQIVKDLTLAQGAIKGAKDIAAVADSYAKVIMVAAERAKVPAQKILEENRLKITQGFQDTLDNMGGKDAGLDGLPADTEVQGSAAGGKQAGVVGGAASVRGRLPGQGASPTERSWHGTEAKPEAIAALKAEGLSRNGAGGMGGGLHLSAGPDVAVKYAKGNKDGLWKASIKDLVPFDASLDTIHGPDVLRFLGLQNAPANLTGSDVWDWLKKDLGSEEAAQKHLEGKGFNGLFYNHGGEDAWAVWKDANIQGSRLTTEEQARAEYASQGSWRDPLTGFLKEVAQITLESAPGSVSPLKGYDKLKPAKQAQYHAEKMAAAARALEAAGIQVRSTTTGNGYWGGESNLVTRLVVRPDKIQEAARIVADVVNDQEGVGWNRAVEKGTENAIWLRFPRPLTKAEVVKIGKVMEAAKVPAFLDNSKQDELKVISYDDTDMSALAGMVKSNLPGDLAPISAETYTAESGVEERGHGSDVGRPGAEANSARRSAVQRSIVNGRAEIAALNQRYGLGEVQAGAQAPEVTSDITTLFQSLSSRLPWNVGAENDPNTVLLSGLQALLEAPTTLAKNIAQVRTYPGVKIDKRLSPEAAAEKFIQHVEGNLLWLYEQTPAAWRNEAKKWYDGANKLAEKWAKEHDKTLGQLSGVFATLSPQKDWFQNVSLAERVITIMRDQQDTVWSKDMEKKLRELPALKKLKPLLDEARGKKLGEISNPEAQALWLRLYDETYNARSYQIISPSGDFQGASKTTKGVDAKVAWGSLNEIAKALSIYKSADPKLISESLGNMHKVRNFYNNIFDPNSPDFVTIDTHAVNAGLLLPMGGNHPIVGHNFGSTGSSSAAATGAVGTYGLYQEAYNRAAQKVGVFPREMQSITWEAVRGMFTDTFKTSANYDKVADQWGLFKAGKQTIEETRSAILKLAGGITAPAWAGPGSKTLFQGNMPGAITVNGVHYSPQAGLTELDPTKYGTGSAGAEGRRLRGLPQEDRNRTFMYEVKDGVVPPKEAVVRGQNKYTAQVSNVYDLDQDVLGLRGSSQDLNELEKTLREQGYRGYVATAPGMDARGIVLLGSQKTAVKPLPDPAQVKVLYQQGSVKTETPEFKAWFGESSTLVNENGTPMVLYHGTDRSFTEFKPSKTGAMGDGIYFGLGPEAAAGYAGDGKGSQMIPVFLRGKYLDNYQWSDYVSKHGWKGAKDAAIKDGFSGVVDSKFEDAVVVWNPTDIKSALANRGSFDPRNPSILHQPSEDNSPRGALRYTGPNGDRDFNMALLKNQNKSTVMHELGHFYLEIIGDLATQSGSDQQIKDDYAKILKWFGVDSREQITVAHHEKFADAHLLYLLEGKAPVKELVPAFKRFSNWLAKIGQKLIAADVEINDDVRGIFDRLYATEQELANAQQQMPELFTTADQLGISQAEFNLLAKEKAKAIDEAHERVTRQVMRELASEDREEYQNAKKAITEAVTEEVDAMPEYQALAALKTAEPTMKINRGLAEDLYGKDKVASLPKDLLNAEGGLDPDAAATIYGFPSGDAMVDAMTSLPARGKAISLEVQSRLDMTFPSMKDTGELRVRAVEALNGDRKGDVLAAELKIFEKNADKVLAPSRAAQAEKEGKAEARGQSRVKTIREAAKRHVATLPISRINPFQYFQAQQSASRKAFDAALNKDWTTAATEKERELLNHFLFLESLKVKEASEDFRDWVAKNDSSRVRAKIAQAGGDFLAQFDALRDRFGIDRLPNKAVERKLALGQWVEQMTAEGLDTVIDPELLDESRTKNYREMTMPEMQGVWDALKNIKHLAYNEFSTIIKGKRVERAAMVDEIDAAARANNVTRPQLRSTDPKRDRAGHRAEAWLRGKDAMMVKVESIINWIDGGDVNGPAHRYIFNRLADAQTHEYTLQKEITGKLIEVMESIPKEQRTKDKDNVEIEGFGTATKGELMTMLLYWGQDVRREKLLSGYATRGLTEEGLLAAFDQYLTPADIALANQIWASFAHISQDVRELEKRLTGVMPDFDAATPFSIKAGALTGGYMPLVADRAISGELGKKQEGGPLGDLFGNGYVRAKTSTSHVKEITGAVYPLSLDYHSILTAGLANQIKDLTHREAVLDIRRLFMNKKFQDAIKESIGEDYEAQLMPWLANVVNERNAGASQGLQKFSSFLTALRANTVAAMLGFKLTTTVIQVLDAPRALLPGEGQVKGRFAASAFFKTLENPAKAWEMITEKSGEMRFRADNLDRDIRQQLQKMTGDLSLKAKSLRWGFAMLSVMDKISSRLVWLGSYQQALAAEKDEATAILEADKTVRLRLMSGNPKDLIAIQRGNDALKLVTMFLGDATANYNVLRNLGHDIRGFKGVPTLAMSALVMMGLQIMGELIKGQGPDDEDDAAAWIARKAMLTPASNVPILRDFANALDGALSGNPIKAEYRFTPVVQMFQKVIQGVQSSVKMAQGEEELEDWLIKTGSALGYAVGVPGTSQAEASAKYLRRYQQGEESPDNVLELGFNAVRGKKREK